MTRRRAWALAGGGVALVALVLVAGSLAQMSLGPGDPLPAVAPEAEEARAEAAIPILGWLDDAAAEVFFKVVYVLVLALLAASIVALIVSPEMRKQFLGRLVVPLLVLVTFLLSRENAEVPLPPPTAVPANPGAEVSGADGPIVAFDPSPPKSVVWGTRIVVGACAALVVAGATWLLWRSRRAAGSPPLAQVAEQARQAIRAVEAGGDVRNVVLRCYFEMSRILDEERGLLRQSTMTPREFERSLAATGLPEPAVQRLTRLFEGVRYGAKLSGGDEEAEAIASLTAIADACRSAA